jgi:glycerophosphoryl diester phosphodiesterase
MNIILEFPKNHLIGHRGVAGLRPENTYCSFEYAAALGLQWIEFDTMLTKDDQWIIMHDDELDRTTNGHGLVKDHTLAQLNALEAGLWYKPAYQNQKIPTLLGTLELAYKLKLFCNVEVKGSNLAPQKHAELMCEFINNHQHITNKQIIISSFDVEFLKILRHLNPNLPIGYLIDHIEPDSIDNALENNFNTLNCAAEKLTPYNIDTAINNDLPICIYTINDPNMAKFWIQRGASAIFTDRPDLIL